MFAKRFKLGLILREKRRWIRNLIWKIEKNGKTPPLHNFVIGLTPSGPFKYDPARNFPYQSDSPENIKIENFFENENFSHILCHHLSNEFWNTPEKIWKFGKNRQNGRFAACHSGPYRWESWVLSRAGRFLKPGFLPRGSFIPKIPLFPGREMRTHARKQMYPQMPEILWKKRRPPL